MSGRRHHNPHKLAGERAEKLAAIEEQVRAGTLTIRHATPEERARWTAERTARDVAYRPDDAELVLPGVSARQRADLDHRRERDDEETGR